MDLHEKQIDTKVFTRLEVGEVREVRVMYTHKTQMSLLAHLSTNTSLGLSLSSKIGSPSVRSALMSSECSSSSISQAVLMAVLSLFLYIMMVYESGSARVFKHYLDSAMFVADKAKNLGKKVRGGAILEGVGVAALWTLCGNLLFVDCVSLEIVGEVDIGFGGHNVVARCEEIPSNAGGFFGTVDFLVVLEGDGEGKKAVSGALRVATEIDQVFVLGLGGAVSVKDGNGGEGVLTSLAKKDKVWVGTRVRLGEGVVVEDHGSDGGDMLELSGDARDTLLVEEGVVVADGRGYVEVVGFNGEAIQRWTYDLGLGVRLCRPLWSSNQTFGVFCGSVDFVSHLIGDARVRKLNVYYEDDYDNEGKVMEGVALGMRDERRVVCLRMGGQGDDEMLALSLKLNKNG